MVNIFLTMNGLEVLAIVFYCYVNHAHGQLNLGSCGTDKGCFGVPEGCTLTNACNRVVTYRRDPSNSQYVLLELATRLTTSNKYIAVGFSNDGQMGADAVSACIYISGASSPNVVLGYNADGAKRNEILSGVGPQTVSLDTGGVSGDTMWCRFRQAIRPSDTQGGKIYPLDQSYYLLLAEGNPTSSTSLSYHSGRDASPSRVSVTANVFASSTIAPSAGVDLRGCGTTKGCFGAPVGCVSTGSCTRVVTYRVDPTNNQNMIFELAVQLSDASQSKYVAVGFSEDSEMGNDSVSVCINFPTASVSPTVAVAYNNPDGTPTPNEILSPSPAVTTLESSGVTNGNLWCRFRQVVRPANNNQGKIFSLDKSYYLLLAEGTMQSANRLNYHSQKNASPSPLSLSSTSSASETTTSTSVTRQSGQTGGSRKVGSIDISTCGRDKGCFGNPDTCLNDGMCERIVTYQLDSTANPRMVAFEMAYKTTGQNNFVAVGFSNDQEMGSDAVTACISNGGQNRPNVVLAYNNGKSSAPLSSVISPPVTTNETGGLTDGYFWCRFKQHVNPTNNGSGQVYPLDVPYYLLLAAGTPTSSSTLSYHGRSGRSASGQAINVTSTASGSASDEKIKRNLIKAHGIMMIFGWWLFATTAIIFARYFRQMWPNTEWFKIKPWFHFHRGFNTIAIVLIIAAFICIFVAERDWVGKSSEIHAICGITCTICALIQPLMALFRCHPGTPKRFIFNWLHRTIGLAGWVIASATIWFASEATFPSPLSTSEYYANTPQTLFILFWAGLGATILALEVHLTVTERFAMSRVAGNDIALQPAGHPAPYSKAPPHYSKSWSIVRVVILLLFIGLALGVTITLATYIGLWPTKGT